jgi:hypothetical protein
MAWVREFNPLSPPEFDGLLCENPANLHGGPSAATGRGNAACVEAVGHLPGGGKAGVANVCDDWDEIFELRPNELVREFAFTPTCCLATTTIGLLSSMMMPKPRRKPQRTPGRCYRPSHSS